MSLDISTSLCRKGFKAFLTSQSASYAPPGSSQAELGHEACENGGEVRRLNKNIFHKRCVQGALCCKNAK